MPVKSKEILEHFETEEKNKEEQKAIVGKVIAAIESEIEMLGKQRTARQERNAAALVAAMQECDERADFLIRRKDLMNELLLQMNGDHPGPIALPDEMVMIADKRPARGEPGRKGSFLSFGKKQRTA